jgi:gamma-glutamylcyclotransferase
MYYFSYGSNMSIRRLRLRVPSVACIGSGILKGHELRFQKVSSRDGSAKCDAVVTANPNLVVYGVVYRIDEAEKPGLDRAEGLGFGYEQKNVLIEMENGADVQAFCYFATEIDPQLKPLDWYREHVLKGARENNLPGAYIRSIEAIEAVKDDDAIRREKELSVYR